MPQRSMKHTEKYGGTEEAEAFLGCESGPGVPPGGAGPGLLPLAVTRGEEQYTRLTAVLFPAEAKTLIAPLEPYGTSLAQLAWTALCLVQPGTACTAWHSLHNLEQPAQPSTAVHSSPAWNTGDVQVPKATAAPGNARHSIPCNASRQA